MLFSVPDQAWWWIAVGATVAAAITFVVLPPEPGEAPEAVRAVVERNRKIGRWGACFGVPALCAVVGLTALIGPEPTPVVLFLYSVAAGSMPIALLPIRRRMHRHYFAQLQTPGSKITLDRLSATWLYSVFGIAILVSTAAVMSATYEPRGL
ncbi:hypothetical protein AB0G74_15095 [Streptomyces sp. NPDC020875]|uniref:hypothetical protein n=1 Tax=Streptomyces sp. NPDC020875 TaxID=3154898 RepID=UPI0033F37667